MTKVDQPQMELDFHFIRRCILSCSNKFQIECGHAMLHLFRQKYANDPELKDHEDVLLLTIQEKETELSLDA